MIIDLKLLAIGLVSLVVIFSAVLIFRQTTMPKKRKNPNLSLHALEMTKHESGCDITDETTGAVHSLPSDFVIHKNAVEICAGYNWPKALEILKRSSLEIELVNEQGVYQNHVGVVLIASETDANMLGEDWDTYSYIMSAVGEACTTIQLEHDRVRVDD